MDVRACCLTELQDDHQPECLLGESIDPASLVPTVDYELGLREGWRRALDGEQPWFAIPFNPKVVYRGRQVAVDPEGSMREPDGERLPRSRDEAVATARKIAGTLQECAGVYLQMADVLAGLPEQAFQEALSL